MPRPSRRIGAALATVAVASLPAGASLGDVGALVAEDCVADLFPVHEDLELDLVRLKVQGVLSPEWKVSRAKG